MTGVLQEKNNPEPSSPPTDEQELVQRIGANLRRIRTRNGLSLDRLSKLSGVSKAMLGQVELGRSSPTITVLWKIAESLEVPVSLLTAESGSTSAVVMRASRASWIHSASGAVLARPLLPAGLDKRTELYEVHLQPSTTEQRPAHSLGAVETVLVVQGRLELQLPDHWYCLEAGDAISFAADVPHSYRTATETSTILHIVISHAAADALQAGF